MIEILKEDGKLARPRRIISDEHFHHVTSRGNWKYNIFKCERDYYYFLKLLHKFHETNGIEVASYCLMSNHYHLLIRSKETSLSYVMGRINKAYCDYFNYHYNVSGHLYQKRFYSDPVYDELGLAEVSRYIHLNPTEAKMVLEPQDYRWSSFYYLHQKTTSLPTFLDFTPILDLFPGKTYEQRLRQYCGWIQLKTKERV